MPEGGSAPTHGRALPAPGDLISDRYRIEKVLGRGGMGVAYAATNVVTGKQIALKWILRDPNASRLQRLLREARAAGRIRHPNIVDVYDVGEHEGSLFLVMELLTGQSLQDLLDERGPLQPDQLLHWLIPALRGVRAAHRRGVIHRDLKPGNIFLCCDEAGEPLAAKVLDFGVSKIVAAEVNADEQSLTDSNALVGTPSYTAPEQLERARNATERSDIYGCGAILYHALSGKRPFEAERKPAQLAIQIMTSAPVPLGELRPDLPRALCDVVERAMHRRPEQRFPDVDALIRALEPFAPSHPVPGPRALRVSGTLKPRTRQHLSLIALILLLLLISFGLHLGWAGKAATILP